MDFKKDYYRILEVTQTATPEEIRSSYRRLAKKYHPDRNPGNIPFEELTKAINEAKEVLLNSDNRFIYDEYRKSEAEEALKQQQESQAYARKQRATKTASTPPPEPPKKKKTYTRIRTVETVIRRYFKGTIFIKYYAPFEMEKEDINLREFYYKIHFTDVWIEMNESDMIVSDLPPTAYKAAFADHAITDIPIKSPVQTILQTDSGEKAFLFYIQDLRITNPQITLVTKHESTSFGTIESPVYGYIKQSTFHEITEEVEESSGPTGKQETKVEDDIQYKREEYYYYNGDTYWGPWIRETPFYRQHNFTPSGSTDTQMPRQSYQHYVSSGGCASSTLSTIIIIIYILFLLIAMPAIWPAIVFLLVMYLLGTLLTFIAGPNGRIGGWFTGIFLLLFFLAMLNKCTSGSHRIEHVRTITESPKEREKPVTAAVHTYDTTRADTLITRFRAWEDYDKNPYAGKYTIRSSQVRSAGLFKENIPYPVSTNYSYDRMVHDLKDHDSATLSSLYTLFDTLGVKHSLSQKQFAEMIVSFVQDIPYSLVLDKACDPLQYNIPSVREYLAKPDAICEPYQRFGINTPVEFLATLKGDCDTRALLLYQVLAHYQFDVVMLTSDLYNHSLIGINLPYTGSTYNYAGTPYILWETTSPDFRPGFIPAEIGDLHYWRISLKSK